MSEINPQPKRKYTPKIPSLMVIVSIFAGSMLVSGALIYLVLTQFVVLPTNSANVRNITASSNGIRQMNTPPVVHDFTMPSHTGEVAHLSNWRGKAVLLFFGYTFCPDVCPVTVSDMKQVHEALGDAAGDVQFVFISVDGERDTPERLQIFLDAHQVSEYIVGLSGTKDTLRPMQADYGLYYKLNAPDENGNYSVDHSSRVYLVDRAGKLTHSFAYGTDAAVIASIVRSR